MYFQTMEWHYRYLQPRVMVEQYIPPPLFPLPRAWRIHCFHGGVRFIEVEMKDESGDVHTDVYNRDWER
ncbi:TPA: hypothetical protein R4G84_002885 [Salmonella enterica subsp. enterica serovar Mississippi]|nr:hypothetical protein [Salmonella enterica subsp. enterica]ECW0788941.1 hypothetical protein [Salmonella enterica subsp. enterica]HED0168004.1 hypothetical protein [Salmonella enterica subsp. enterica serovar Mississippi]HED0173868.1 hypothetical protein [Salmonella enterica subsp. enterica serovar Mississippi]HED0195863.1 hypothetical protein [Salmonella enterica subsp. enterica serovar Mississippi]